MCCSVSVPPTARLADFDRLDICAAYNVYSQTFGWSRFEHAIQARLSRLDYKPCDSDQRLRTLSDNAKAIYAGLVRRHQGVALAISRFERKARGRAVLSNASIVALSFMGGAQ